MYICSSFIYLDIHLPINPIVFWTKLLHVGFGSWPLFQPLYVTLCVYICVCLHEDMSATVVSRHVLKEAGTWGANVVGKSGDEVTSAKATTPSWKQLHPVSSSCWQTLLQHLRDNLEYKKARQEKLSGLKLQWCGINREGLPSVHLVLHRIIYSLNLRGAWGVMTLDWTERGSSTHPDALWSFHTPLVINLSTSHYKKSVSTLSPCWTSFPQERKYLKDTVKFNFCIDYNKVQDRQLIELSYCDSLDAVLEVFGDVVVGLGVLQEFYQSIRCHLYQLGALYILWGQWTPHNLQVLWQDIKTQWKLREKVRVT